MKKTLALAAAALLSGSIPAVVLADAAGPLNNGVFNTDSTHGHILSDLRVQGQRPPVVTGKEGEISTFETAPRPASTRLNNGVFSTSETYGHILADPDLLKRR